MRRDIIYQTIPRIKTVGSEMVCTSRPNQLLTDRQLKSMAIMKTMILYLCQFLSQISLNAEETFLSGEKAVQSL